MFSWFQLKKELKRCEALKRANIEKFVLQLRQELLSWWDRCYYSQEQKDAFSAFRYTDFSEDVLDLHELEVNKLRTFYEKNRFVVSIPLIVCCLQIKLLKDFGILIS